MTRIIIAGIELPTYVHCLTASKYLQIQWETLNCNIA